MPLLVVAHGPRMPELSLANAPSVAVAVKLVKSTTAPLCVKLPATVSVRFAAAFQLCFPNNVRPQLRVRLCVAVLRSMPDVPMVRVLPGPSVTGPAGPMSLMPAQLRSAASTGVLAAVTSAVHCAMSAAPGKLSQLLARLSASVLFALVQVAACAAGPASTSAAAKQPAMAAARWDVTVRGDMVVFLQLMADERSRTRLSQTVCKAQTSAKRPAVQCCFEGSCRGGAVHECRWGCANRLGNACSGRAD